MPPHISPDISMSDPTPYCEARVGSMMGYLRNVVFAGSGQVERLHAVFLDPRRSFLSDEAFGRGGTASLSLRMRDLFSRALAAQASGMIIAHNHPSGHCRPSELDVIATRKLVEIGQALDIELIDHLIFTRSSVYSMRAGGDL